MQSANVCQIQQTEQNVSFSVETTWKNYRIEHENCACKSNDVKWKKGIQEYHDGCRYTKQRYHGVTHEITDKAMDAFQQYLTKLIFFTNSNSTVLTSSCTNMLTALSKCNKLNGSSKKIMVEYDKVLPKLANDVKAVVVKLSPIIGPLARTFNNALDKLLKIYIKFTKQFILCSTSKCRMGLDYGIVFQESKDFMNSVKVIVDLLVNGALATRNVYEAVTILCLILQYWLIVVQATNSSIQDIMYNDGQRVVSSTDTVCSDSLDYVLVSLTQAINALVFPFAESIQQLLSILTDITKVFSATIQKVTAAVGDVTQNLLKAL